VPVNLGEAFTAWRWRSFRVYCTAGPSYLPPISALCILRNHRGWHASTTRGDECEGFFSPDNQTAADHGRALGSIACVRACVLTWPCSCGRRAFLWPSRRAVFWRDCPVDRHVCGGSARATFLATCGCSISGFHCLPADARFWRADTRATGTEKVGCRIRSPLQDNPRPVSLLRIGQFGLGAAFGRQTIIRWRYSQ